MQMTDIIDGLNSISGDIVTDEKSVCQNIMKAQNIYFLDTCFMSNNAKMPSSDVPIRQMKAHPWGKRAVFVLTPLVIYELQGNKADAIDSRVRLFIEKIHNAGIEMFVVAEEKIVEIIEEIVITSLQQRNSLITECAREMAKRFETVKEGIKGTKYEDYIFRGKQVPSDKDYVKNYFSLLRSKKSNNDSLAEILIAHVSLYILKKFDYDSHRVTFVSDDIKSFGEMYMTELKKYKGKSFHTINTLTMIAGGGRSSAASCGLNQDKKSNMNCVRDFYATLEELKLNLQSFRQNFKLVMVHRPGFDSTFYEVLSSDEVAEFLWDGCNVQYPVV